MSALYINSPQTHTQKNTPIKRVILFEYSAQLAPIVHRCHVKQLASLRAARNIQFYLLFHVAYAHYIISI